jgi:hypothetical protein
LFVHAQKSGRRVPAACTDGGNWGNYAASIRMALCGVWSVFRRYTSPISFLHRLHKNSQRHVGSPCWVIGLAMAETRRFIPHGRMKATVCLRLPSQHTAHAALSTRVKGQGTFQAIKHPPPAGRAEAGRSSHSTRVYLACCIIRIHTTPTAPPPQRWQSADAGIRTRRYYSPIL